jgi:DNA-binding MarR family transcriptional regulator
VKATETSPGHRIQASLELLQFSSSRAHIDRQLWQQVAVEIDPVLYPVLLAIDYYGPARLAVIANETRISSPAVSSQTGRLERNGLVERSTDPFDHRMTMVQVSSAGRVVLGHIHNELAHRTNLRLASWPAGEAEHFANLLEMYVRDLRQSQDW